MLKIVNYFFFELLSKQIYTIYYTISNTLSMPFYRKKYRKKSRKYKKKKRKSNSWLKTTGSGLVRSSPFGKRFTFKSKYVALGLILDPGLGGVPATYVFSANGLYDPDVTGTGHQPIGFDQLMPMYDHYTVIGSRIKVRASNDTSGKSQYFILSLSDTHIHNSDTVKLLENGQNRYTIMGPADSGTENKTLTLNCNPSKFLGHQVMQTKACQGNINSNPSEQVYYHVTVGPVDNTSDSAQVTIMVEIEYIAILTEPKQLASS